MALCLFLPEKISVVNDELSQLAKSRDHPVWITRAEKGIRLKGLEYDKVGSSSVLICVI